MNFFIFLEDSLKVSSLVFFLIVLYKSKFLKSFYFSCVWLVFILINFCIALRFLSFSLDCLCRRKDNERMMIEDSVIIHFI